MRQNAEHNNNKSEEDISFLTTIEVAQLLRVHQRTVQRWILSNNLKATKVGPRIWRIRQKDLDKFLQINNSKKQA
ncbi:MULTISPECIES: helix-turn-helix domain-containing protein [unclassified Nostoc]|uniref:helix-turn-helix domain-containing protein n=1 Tax=unclassified Nostoc TaxID=2593658 RepID=UPI002AD2EE8B|nr:MULTISPECIES: helix-turn-helix domain-containing protein [unclassified Nostoc]MDZ8122243.1 helix-turn-helix domain-containing protein [Nostoc sp. CmiVER01]MDZ8225365.1 helix-turn-helix domain-containing protein [Nostoc sp. ChiVER01]